MSLAARWQMVPRVVRYTLVGGFCAVLNNLLLIGTVQAGIGYMTAVWVICAPMLVIGYLLHVVATFEAKPALVPFLRYSAGILASYPVWIGSLFVLCDLLTLPIAAASIIATGIVFAWNYVATHLAFRARLGFARAEGPAR